MQINPPSNPSENRISVCIIAKNEENYIESCIKSVLPIAYEIIVLDTGSTDSTLDICNGFVGTEQCSVPTKPTIKIFETTWDDDFSKARNECISHATGEWILSIDADEVLTEDTQKQLLPFLKEQNPTNIPVIYNFLILSPKEEKDRIYTTFFRNALFKNGCGIHFVRPLHEQLTSFKNDIKTINCSFFKIYHYGDLRPKEELDKKLENYIISLKKIISENPDKTDNYYYYYFLGSSYLVNEKPDLALQAFYFSQTLFEQKFNKKDSFYANILRDIIVTLIDYKKDYKEALLVTINLLDLSPTFADGLYYHGYCLEQLDNYQEAISFFEKAIKMLDDNSSNPMSLNNLGKSLEIMLMNELGRCFMLTGEIKKSENCLLTAYKLSPKAAPVLINLICYYLLQDNLEEAVNYFFIYKDDISFSAKENFIIISRQSPSTYEYKNLMLKILKGLSKLDGFLKEEEFAIKDKIFEIEKSLKKVMNKINTPSNPSENRISVCIIAKNEENYIESCIKSVLPIAYEIIVLDTGSTDSTLDICRGFVGTEHCSVPTKPTIKIFQTTWDDDFSKARNECISHATGEWILSIDADEVLTEDTQKQLLPFLKEQNYNDIPVVFNFKIISPQRNNNLISTALRHVLFRNGWGTKFKRAMHEHLFNPEQELREVNTPFLSIYHTGNLLTTEELEGKSQKYVNRLLKAIEENPDKSDNYYYYYYLGSSYVNLKQYREAVESFLQAYNLYSLTDMPTKHPFFGNILIDLATTMIFHMRLYKEPIIFIEELLHISPDFPDALFYLGYCIQYLGNYRYAISCYERVINIFESNENPNKLALISLEQSILKMLFCELGRCYLALGNEKGLDYLERGLSISPLDSKILLQLTRYYLVNGSLYKALTHHFKNNVMISESSKQILLNKASLPDSNQSYKEIEIEFLKGLDIVPGWLKEEKESITNRIITIEKSLNTDNEA